MWRPRTEFALMTSRRRRTSLPQNQTSKRTGGMACQRQRSQHVLRSDEQRDNANGRCRGRRRRVCRPVSLASPAQGRLFRGRDGGGRRRRRHLVLEPLSRRALRHPDHRLQLHLRSRTGEARGSGRRNTPPSRKSCAISASSPTATTSGATSASAPRSSRRHWDDATERWQLATDNGASVSCRYYIMATGCLSAPKPPEIDGVKDFKGEVYFTGRWPHDERRSHRQARRRDRHGIIGHPVDPADRRAGGASHRVPAHAELCAARA